MRKGRVASDDEMRIADPVKAKAKFLELLPHMTGREAMRIIGRAESTYEGWRKNDPQFKEAVDQISRIKKGGRKREVPDFESFCGDFLHQPMFWHQQQWVDVLEGREPRELHPAQMYEPGDPGLILVNTPPGHSKTTTITENYVTWRLLQNPNIKVLLVSKSQQAAQKFLYAIKARLTGPRYRGLQTAFGPEGGFAATAEQWTATQIYLGDKDDGEKDPTIQALGIGGQIYGARADLIVVDDAVVLSNAAQYEEQTIWLTQEVASRLPGNGTLLVVGTRVRPHDLYKELRKQFEGEWTYFASPAVLEDTGDPETTVTLWPKTNLPCGCRTICQPRGWDKPDENGLFPKWDGHHLQRARRGLLAGSWSLMYQQADVAEDQTFPEAAVVAALNKRRTAGLMTDGFPGHRDGGMSGLHIICSMDPALSGSCAAVAMGVDVRSGMRWVLDLHNEAGMTPASIHALIKRWTEKYHPREWRIEKNAMQGMLTQDEGLRRALNAQGCILQEHHTDGRKWDEDYGIAGMAPLFLPALEGRQPLIDLPGNAVQGGNSAAAVRTLVAQLVAWRPKPAGEVRRRDKPGTTDLVMALWFADVRARELVLSRRAESGFVKNPFATRGMLKQRRLVNLTVIQNEQEAERRLVYTA